MAGGSRVCHAYKMRLTLATIRDARLTQLVCIGMGEGCAMFLGNFDGRPAYIVDNNGLRMYAEAFGSAEDLDDLVFVEVFDDTVALDRHVAEQRRANPRAFSHAEPRSGIRPARHERD